MIRITFCIFSTRLIFTLKFICLHQLPGDPARRASPARQEVYEDGATWQPDKPFWQNKSIWQDNPIWQGKSFWQDESNWQTESKCRNFCGKRSWEIGSES